MVKEKTRPEAEYSYYNKFLNREFRFAPKADEVLVTFPPRPEGDGQEIAELTAEAALPVSQGINLRRGFAALRVPPESEAVAESERLGDVPDLLNSIPVLIDDEGSTRYVLPDELTVQFRPEVAPEQAEGIVRDLGSSILVRQRTPGYYTLAVPAGQGLFETIRAFSERPEVAFAEPSEAGFNDALFVPSDARFTELWGLDNTGQTVNGAVGTSDADIGAVEAWDIVRGDPEVIVCVIDTGADLDHPDLLTNILARGSEDWDFADGADPSPDDVAPNGHGTHVSGTTVGVGNAQGVIGVAHASRLMPLRIDLISGMNQNRADAINYVAGQAAANPARRYVINCSWRANGDHAGIRSSIQNAVNSNVVVVFAAGNDNANINGTPQRFPAVYPEVIAVAATDASDRRAWFSNFGPGVDISAPGVNILSTIPDNNHGFLDGTSMASPHVAGAAALVWSYWRGWTNRQVRDILELSVDPIDHLNPTFAGQLGRGRLDVHRALLHAPAIAGRSQSGFFIQARYGTFGNFEVVTPASGSGLRHFWRNNEPGAGFAWNDGGSFAAGLGHVEAAVLIQGNFGQPGNLEAIARVGDHLVHLWRDGSFAWHTGVTIATGVGGSPALIQARYGGAGNFEVVVPSSTAGLRHFWRNNDAPGLPWNDGGTFGTALGRIDAVALIQGNFGLPGNLEVVARAGDRLIHLWRDGSFAWHTGVTIATGVTGTPALIQGRYGVNGNFEVLVPDAVHGLRHFWRNNDPGTGLPWSAGGHFATHLGRVAEAGLLQANFGARPGNLEAVARAAGQLTHFWRDAAFTWHDGPTFASGVA